MKLYLRFYRQVDKLQSHWLFRFLLFFYILIFSFHLRSYNYNVVPSANHLDEMQFAWSGLYLIETGVPVSWSGFDYPNRALFYDGKISYKENVPEEFRPTANVKLYRPWLEEPPLFSLIVGYFAHINGVNRTEFIPSTYIRIPMLYFALITSILIFLIARKVSGYWTGILSLTLYSTIPIFVISSRTAMSENFIAMLYMAIIYLVLKYLTSQRFIFLLPVTLLIGAAGLSKPTGFLILPFVIFIVCINEFKKSKAIFLQKILYLIATILPFIFLFFAYGFYYDAEIFKWILSINANRPVGFNSLSWFFISPSSDTKIIKDSWYVFCLLAAAYYIFKPPKDLRKYISLAFIYAVIIIMMSGGEGDLLSWYRFPSFPLLAIMGSWAIVEIVKKGDFFATFLAVGMLLGNRLLLVNPFRPNLSPMLFRLIFISLMLPATVNFFANKRVFRYLSKFIIILVVLTGIYINVLYVYNAFIINCENRVCPLVPFSELSFKEMPLFAPFITFSPLK